MECHQLDSDHVRKGMAYNISFRFNLLDECVAMASLRSTSDTSDALPLSEATEFAENISNSESNGCASLKTYDTFSSFRGGVNREILGERGSLLIILACHFEF